MILLDANVVSELMRKSPRPAVEAWATGSKGTGYLSACGPAPLPPRGRLLGLSLQRDAAAVPADLAGARIAVRTSGGDSWTAIVKEVVQRFEHRVLVPDSGRSCKETNDGNPD